MYDKELNLREPTLEAAAGALGMAFVFCDRTVQAELCNIALEKTIPSRREPLIRAMNGLDLEARGKFREQQIAIAERDAKNSANRKKGIAESLAARGKKTTAPSTSGATAPASSQGSMPRSENIPPISRNPQI